MKVLVISHNSFSKVHNNGKTLESFLINVLKNDISQLYFRSEIPDFEYCNNYFKITDVDVLKSLLLFSSTCGQSLEKSSFMIPSMTCKLETESKLFKILQSKSAYLTIFRDILWNCRSWNTKTFRAWCKGNNPDLLFYVGGNFGFSHQIAFFLSQYLNKPLVTYLTDDYLIHPIRRNFLDIIHKQQMKSFYRRTINHSSLCFAIGELMCKEYSAYFNKEFFPLMNSIPKQDYHLYIKKSEVIISYFGGLHLNRWKMLVRFARLSFNSTINIYTMDEPSVEILKQFQANGICFKGALSGKNLQNEILNSDILLHVESDDVYNKSLTKLSISTKIPEYLISGRLVVGFGPEDVASMKLLSDNEIGIVISSLSSDSEIKAIMQKIITDFDLRKSIGFRGYNYAINKFDNKQIAYDFIEKLRSIANK
ncbi:MAG: hypothetical protein RSA53_09990 [Odoribacter sp.]